MKKSRPPEKETASYRAYKRATFWQIIFPMIVVALIFAAVSVTMTMRGGDTLSQWADVSTIWLLLPVIGFSIIILLILVGLIYGLAKLLEIMPTYTYKLSAIIRMIGEKIKSVADGAAKPVFMIEGFSASLRRIFRKK